VNHSVVRDAGETNFTYTTPGVETALLLITTKCAEAPQPPIKHTSKINIKQSSIGNQKMTVFGNPFPKILRPHGDQSTTLPLESPGFYMTSIW